MIKRLYNIDLLKGFLIVLVIIGHIIGNFPFEELNRNNTIILSIIYSFHIPVFIGISGFLLNINKLITLNAIALLKKYWLRLILPWMIACLVYFFFSDKAELTYLYPIKALLRPYYHLWFIPAFLFWVLLTWFLKNKMTNNLMFLFIGLLITLISVVLKKIDFLYKDYETLNAILFYVLNVLKPYYYFFFAVGIYLKDKPMKKINTTIYAILFVSFIGVIYFFYYPSQVLSTLNLFILNTSLLFILVRLAKYQFMFREKALEWTGINSLGLYLWHVIPIIMAKWLSHKEDSVIYIVIVLVLEVLFFIIYKQLVKIEVFKKYVFGM